MVPYRGKVGLRPGERPRDAQNTLKNIFSKVSCLECGICCRTPDEQHSVLVLGNEPHRRPILASANASKMNVRHGVWGSFRLESYECCGFIREHGAEKRCYIYDKRPAICEAYPFMVQEVKAGAGKGGSAETRQMVVLTSACPPVSRAKAAGISYVTSEDLLQIVRVDGKDEQKPGVQVLGSSLISVLEFAKTGILFSEDAFLTWPGQSGRVFPIL